METKIIKILWEGKEAEVEIKRFKYGEKLKVQEYALIQENIGNIPKLRMSSERLHLMTIVKGVVKAPFKTDMASVQDFPARIGEKLFEEIDVFNTVTPEKKDNLNGPSDKDHPIQE